MTKGIRTCERCKKNVLEWTRREVMEDGKFYSVCRTCFAEMNQKNAQKDFNFNLKAAGTGRKGNAKD